MTKFITTLIVGLAACLSQSATAQYTAKERFIGTPFDILPTISTTTRLDMIDYFESGSDRPSQSFFRDPVRITSLTPFELTVQTSGASRATFCVPDTTAGYTVVIETVSLPQPDSRVYLYDNDWKLIDKKDAGLLAEWITPGGKKLKKQPDIENSYEFVTAEAVFDHDASTIVFTPTLQPADSTEPDAAKQFILPSRTFIITSKGLKEKK